MKKQKIIHILPHSPSPEAYVKFENANLPDNFIEIPVYPGWAGFFVNDWHIQSAKETLRNTDKFEVECWRFYNGIEKVYSKNINGIKHVILPSKIFRPLNIELSIDTLQRLRLLEKENAIIHFNGLFGLNNLFNHLMIYFFLSSSSKVVLHDHGGKSQLHRYISKSGNILNYILHKFEKLFIKSSGSVLYSNSKSLKYLDYISMKRRLFSPMGFTPAKLKKQKNNVSLRNKYGFSNINKIFIIYGKPVGNPEDDVAGFFLSLKIAREFEAREEGIKFLFIGGFEDEYRDLNLSNSKDIKFIPRAKQEVLYDYYQLADGFIFSARSAGVSVMTLESLYFDLPVASTPVSSSISILRNKIDNLVIFEPENYVSMVDAIRRLKKLEKKNNKKIINSHFSWKKIVKNYISVYSSITKR